MDIKQYPCVTGAILRLAYLKAAPDVAQEKRKIYEAHANTCAKCKERTDELRQIAEKQSIDW